MAVGTVRIAHASKKPEVTMATFSKTSDLITALQECDPDGTVTIGLDAALVFRDEELGWIEYSYVPEVEFLFSKANTERSDRVYFRLSKADTEKIVADRHREEEVLETTPCPAHPGIAQNAPVAVAIAISHDTYTNLLTVVQNCNLADENNARSTTHGKLDVPKLLAMLAEDLAMTNTRPGSWEGANMQQVLDSHGYQ